MGQGQSKKKNKQVKRRKRESESDNEYDERPVQEACPYIKVNILYELPGGNIEKREYDIDESKTAKEFKRDLEKFLHIKENAIRVYLHNGSVEMPNNSQVRELNIGFGSILRVRDGSLKY